MCVQGDEGMRVVVGIGTQLVEDVLHSGFVVVQEGAQIGGV